MAASDSPSTMTQQRQQIAAGGENYIYPMSLDEHSEQIPMRDFVRFTAYKGDQPGYTTTQTRGTATDLEKLGSVTLHLPENIENSSKSQFEGVTSGAFGVMGNLGNTMGDGNVLSQGLNLIGGLVATGTQGVLDKLGSNGLNTQIGVDIGGVKMGGFVAGSNKHMLFRGIDFRQFTYQYSILPRSSKESIEINDMIKFLRKNMLPEMAGLNFYQVPNTFTVEYFLGGRPAEFLHKIKPCVLMDCTVKYGGNGAFATFNETDAPAVIELALTFQEIQLVTSSDAAEGY